MSKLIIGLFSFLVISLPLQAADIPTTVLGAKQFDYQECINTKYDECLSTVCPNSSDTDCDSKCKKAATDKCNQARNE